MCGIAGFIANATSNCNEKENVGKLINSIKHRGDTNPEILAKEKSSIACVRLEITGNSSGKQPFVTSDDNYGIVFNGQIYNYLDLKKELKKEGVSFVTDSDTEVLLQSYLYWGHKFIDKIRGMYAFIILDFNRNLFFVARDSYGIKPLYFSKTDKGCYYCSELKPLCDLGLRHIREFPPGSYKINEKITSYSSNYLKNTSQTSDSSSVTFRKLFKESIKRRIATDKSLAVLCSGGIDSSAILYEVSKLNKNIVAYTIGTKNAPDVIVAKELVKSLNVELKIIEVEIGSMLDIIEETIIAIESFEPNHIRAGTANIALASQMKKDGIKVVLCGEGADELLGGYQEFPHALKLEGEKACNALLNKFTNQLYLTQLKRVDRTHMRYSIEARVPFLDEDLSSYIKNLELNQKIRRDGDDIFITKYILRKVYTGRLPDLVVNRRKIPLGEGAGLADNRNHGPFYINAEKKVSNDEYNYFIEKYKDFKLVNKEEVLYFKYFLNHFGKQHLASIRPVTNILKTKQ